MRKAGEQIHNPLTKKTFIFLNTAEDTDGEYVRMKCVADVDSDQKSGFVHKHPTQTEIINVISGSMMTVVNGKKVRYEAGEMIVIKPGDAHQWWNASKKEQLHVTTEIRPALSTQKLYEAACALAQARTSDSPEAPNLLHLAVMIDHYSDIYVVAGKWTLLKKAGFKLLAAIGRMKGYKPEWNYNNILTPQSV
ncbi:cupin domain-containing protein [Mucilaginibacter daejeonensis]|uniref:cupin domain-containing protein n=1 Tax=Mucilaginibacter daejeonensis TaxID=398049 RepID=UPI001D177BDF|nr:cupin domain-containing protein [Mucilaginibacter daejeonensis]UEG54590.1 cupin domain-containing protein [Mucilaginibacter daejeonensis]